MPVSTEDSKPGFMQQKDCRFGTLREIFDAVLIFPIVKTPQVLNDVVFNARDGVWNVSGIIGPFMT